MSKPKIELTTAQANALDRLTSINGMDCWFYIEDMPNGTYRVKDLENNAKVMSTRKALEQLFEGCLVEDLKLLSKEERKEISHLVSLVFGG